MRKFVFLLIAVFVLVTWFSFHVNAEEYEVDIVKTELYMSATAKYTKPILVRYNNKIEYRSFFGVQKAIPIKVQAGEKQGIVPAVTIQNTDEDLTQKKE